MTTGWALAESVHSNDEYDVTAYNLSVLHDEMDKFATLTNDHFIVHMSEHEAGLYGDQVMDLLSRARETLTRKYGVELTQPTVVEIFPEQKDFAVRTFGFPETPATLAFVSARSSRPTAPPRRRRNRRTGKTCSGTSSATSSRSPTRRTGCRGG